LRSAALVRDRVAPVIDRGMPVIVTGDFNVHRARAMERIAPAGLRLTGVPARACISTAASPCSERSTISACPTLSNCAQGRS
jgi:hypothetical protein